MVLTNLYETEFLLKKPFYGFLSGLTYATIAIGLAVIFFPQNPTMVAVGLTALFSFPMINKAMDAIFKKEEKEKIFSLKNLWKDNKSSYLIYLYMFLGIFSAFAIFSLALPQLATGHLFRSQLEIIGYTGKAYFDTGLFTQILANNIKVFGLCFIIALILGNGVLFIITWNASVWGTIFGNLASTAATTSQKNPFIYLLLILISVIPHTLIEASAYITASISGFLISKSIIKTNPKTEKFIKMLLYNLFLFMIGIIILIIGVLIETYVLSNGKTYQTIINQAFR